MKNVFTIILLLLTSVVASAQSITKLTAPSVSGTICPGSYTYYEVSVPSNLTSCQINWSVINGTKIDDPANQRKVSVIWNDTPGTIGTVTATFNNCGPGYEGNNGTTVSKSELILSVKNQSWGSYGTSVNVDYCTKAQVFLTVPRMFVQGTGGIAQPPLTEVSYAWTLPAGWKEVGTGRTGFFGTSTNSISIEPVKCSVPGQVTVYGTLIGSAFCTSSAPSATATISLNGANPVATVGPQAGYTGSTACNTTPVTFYATTSVALGCISGYSWAYPTSWAFVSQNGNSITLRPTGTPADSNPIRATISFSCGSSITSGNYVPPYIAPVIAGSNLICTSAAYSVQNASGVPVTWTSSNTSLATINSVGTVTRVPNANGEVILTATFPCDVPPATKTIWIGKPIYSGETIVRDVNDPNQNVSYVYTYSNPVGFYVSTASGVTSYKWTITSDQSCGSTYNGPKFYSNGNGTHATTTSNKINVNTGTCSGTFWIQCEAINACGVANYSMRLFRVTNSSGGGCDYTLSTYPNPSEIGGDVTINLVPPPPGCETSMTTTIDEISSIAIIDNSGSTMRDETSSGTSHVLLVNKLKRGIYYLKVKTKQGRTFQTRIVKN